MSEEESARNTPSIVAVPATPADSELWERVDANDAMTFSGAGSVGNGDESVSMKRNADAATARI